jgi:hypothetical protein
MHMRTDPAATLRLLLLFVLLLGMTGTLAELVLLEHTESATQWIPLVVLLVAMIAAVIGALRPRRPALLALRAVMAGCIVAGAIGLWLHYSGNVEFELEMYPGMGGTELFWKAMTGATPALAPGTMIQFGLLGLIYTWRHPGLNPPELQR